MQLLWRGSAHGIPYSYQYQDCYFVAESAVAAASYLCLSQLDLPKVNGSESPVCVAELGFGTGLNFLVVAEALSKYCPLKKSSLRFFSCEKHLLSRKQLERSLASVDQLPLIAESFLAAYPKDPAGSFSLSLLSGKIYLSVCFADVLNYFGTLPTKVDRWILDGHDPRKNPEMWSIPVTRHIAKCSASNAVLTTWSSSGKLRRRLTAVGFDVRRIPGFGTKRHSIRAVFSGSNSSKKVSPLLSKPS